MENTKKLQTDELLKELGAKNNILTKLMDENIFKKIFKHSLTKQYYRWINKRTEQQPGKFTWKFSFTMSRFQYSNAQRNVSVNRFEKENAMKIVQNKKNK